MTRSLPSAAALIALLAAGCSQPPPDDAEQADDRPAPQTAPALRLDLTNDTADPGAPRETVVLLDVPGDWQNRESFSGSWSQPADAPTLMLVASGYDDERRAGRYEADREGQTYSLDLHPTFADNNITLSFTLQGPSQGEGQWGHSTFAGYRAKGPVRVRMTGE